MVSSPERGRTSSVLGGRPFPRARWAQPKCRVRGNARRCAEPRNERAEQRTAGWRGVRPGGLGSLPRWLGSRLWVTASFRMRFAFKSRPRRRHGKERHRHASRVAPACPLCPHVAEREQGLLSLPLTHQRATIMTSPEPDPPKPPANASRRGLGLQRLDLGTRHSAPSTPPPGPSRKRSAALLTKDSAATGFPLPLSAGDPAEQGQPRLRPLPR